MSLKPLLEERLNGLNASNSNTNFSGLNQSHQILIPNSNSFSQQQPFPQPPSSQINPSLMQVTVPPTQTQHAQAKDNSCTNSSNTLKILIALAVLSLVAFACKNNIMRTMNRMEIEEDSSKANIDFDTIQVDQEDVVKDPLFQEFE